MDETVGEEYSKIIIFKMTGKVISRVIKTGRLVF